MKGSFVRALALAGVLAIVCVGAALAANNASFLDPTADATSAPDISGVSISNDDAGIVTVKLALANRSQLGPADLFAIGLDVDQNPDSGSAFYGAEYELDFDRGAIALFRNAPNGFFAPGIAPPSLRVVFSDGAATFSFSAADLGITSGFNLYALTADATRLDLAPDIRTFNYQLAGGTSAPLLGRDTRAPLTAAIKSKGVHGKIVNLNYAALDGRGETSDEIVVYRGKKQIRRVIFPIADTNPFFFYSARWKVPKKTKGKFRFCVTSTDRAGNKSKASCAALTIK